MAVVESIFERMHVMHRVNTGVQEMVLTVYPSSQQWKVEVKNGIRPFELGGTTEMAVEVLEKAVKKMREDLETGKAAAARALAEADANPEPGSKKWLLNVIDSAVKRHAQVIKSPSFEVREALGNAATQLRGGVTQPYDGRSPLDTLRSRIRELSVQLTEERLRGYLNSDQLRGNRAVNWLLGQVADGISGSRPVAGRQEQVPSRALPSPTQSRASRDYSKLSTMLQTRRIEILDEKNTGPIPPYLLSVGSKRAWRRGYVSELDKLKDSLVELWKDEDPGIDLPARLRIRARNRLDDIRAERAANPTPPSAKAQWKEGGRIAALEWAAATACIV